MPGHSLWPMDFLDCRRPFCKADSFTILLQLGSALSSPLCLLHLVFLPFIIQCFPSPTSPSKMLWPVACTEPLSWVSSRTFKVQIMGFPFDPLAHGTIRAMNLLSNHPPSTGHAIYKSTWISRKRRIRKYMTNMYREKCHR